MGDEGNETCGRPCPQWTGTVLLLRPGRLACCFDCVELARFLLISHAFLISLTSYPHVSLLIICCCWCRSYQRCRFAVPSSALRAETAWAPKDASAWKETDYEAELKKLEKEAEDRLDAKIEEMMTKIEATGAGK
jgi:hypothetical protein